MLGGDCGVCRINGHEKLCKIDYLCVKNEQDFEGDMMICFLNLRCLFLYGLILEHSKVNHHLIIELHHSQHYHSEYH